MGSPPFATESLNSPSSVCCTHAHRLVGRAVAERVSDEIGNKLPNSDPVAIHGNVDRIFSFDLAARRRQSQFVDHLMQHGLKRLAGIAIEGDASAQPAPRKIEHVVDQSGHPHDGRLQHGDDLMLFVACLHPVPGCVRRHLSMPADCEDRGRAPQ